MSFGVALGMVLAAAAGGQVREPAACAALHAEFKQNEWYMAGMHASNQKGIDQLQALYDQSHDADTSRLILHEMNDMAKYDEEHAVKGDRITTLLLANGCRAPDHVTSWKTYAAEMASK